MISSSRQSLQAAPSHVGQLSNSQIDDIRSQFLSAPSSTDLSSLRPVIARSWRRSLACNVNPESSFWPSTDPRTDEQLLFAAEPVLSELESLCVDVGGAVVLTDADGTLVVFRGDAVQRRNAERIYPTIGGQMREDLIGTNSDGIALEEGRAVQVWGAEHLNQHLTNSYCTSVPVKDPIRRSVRGVLAVILPEHIARDINPRSVLLTVTGAATDITRRLAERLAAREQALMTEYLRETRKRGADAVLAMDDRTTIVSRSALQMFSQSDFAVLAAVARDIEQTDSPKMSKLNVSTGTEVMIHARPMDLTSIGAGNATVMRVHAPSSTTNQTQVVQNSRPRVLKNMLGSSWVFKRALDAAETAVRRRMPCYILGEQGAGKLHMARAIGECISADALLVDFSREKFDSNILKVIDAHLAAGDAVILHRVERAPEEFREQLADFLRILDQPSLIITAHAVTDEILPIIELLRGIEISIPSLRARRDDIPLLAENFAQDALGKKVRISAKLRDALVAADWSGNLTQLRELMRSINPEAINEEVQLSHLNAVQLRMLSRSRLTRLEEAELQQIRAALVESGNNRAKAAVLLGIGRSTLYRKIESYEGRGFFLEIE